MTTETTRRQILKGLTLGSGGVVLSPLISQLAAQASGNKTFPQRFIFVVKSSGLTPGHIVPDNFVDEFIDQKESYIAGEGYTSGVQLKDGDQFVSRSLKEATLNRSMKSLEPFKDRLTILQGLSGNMVTGGTHVWLRRNELHEGHDGGNHRPQNVPHLSLGILSSRALYRDRNHGHAVCRFSLLSGDLRRE